MESRQRNSWWTVGIGSVALALLLLGGTAAFADGQQCYSCGSWCTEQGAIYGMWYDNAPNTPRWVRVGGAGFPACNPGTACFSAVSAACPSVPPESPLICTCLKDAKRPVWKREMRFTRPRSN